MAAVPTYQTSVSPLTPGVTARFQPVSDAASATLADAGERLGANLEQAGAGLEAARLRQESRDREAADRARVEQSRIDEAATQDATVQFAPRVESVLRGTPDQPGILFQQGRAAMDGRAGALEQLNAIRQEAVGHAQNPTQARMFSRVIGAHFNDAVEKVDDHVLKQQEVFQQATGAALLDTYHQQGVSEPDPIKRSAFIDAGIEQLGRNLKRQGLEDPIVFADKAHEFRSGVYKDVIAQANTANPLTAQALLAQHRADLTASDYTSLFAQVTPAARETQAAQNATNLLDGSAGGALANPGSLFPAVEWQESRGRPDAVSPKGAIGVMQLMPATARDELARIGRGDLAGASDATLKQDLIADPALNRTLGQNYLNRLVTRYQGNQALALMAYNAGPGAVDRARKANGDPLQGQVSTERFIAAFPYKETRDYARSIIARSGGLAQQGPTLDQSLADIRARFANDPLAQEANEKALMAESGRRQAVESRDDELKWTAFQPVVQAIDNGEVTNRAQVVNSPAFLGLKPERQTQVLKSLDAATDKAQALALAQQRVGLAVQGKLPIDPKDTQQKKALDLDFTARAAAWGSPTSDSFMAQAVDYAGRTGAVPTTLQSTIRAGLRSGDPATITQSAMVVRQLRNRNPALLHDLNGEDLGLANQVADHVGMGLSPVEAVTMTKNLERVGKPAEAAAKAQFTAQVKTQPTAAFLANTFDAQYGRGALWWHSNPAVSAQLTGEVDQLTREHMALGLTFAAARQTAVDEAGKVWGRSDFNGSPTLMKYAPERAYGVFGDERDAKWMREQIVHDVGPTISEGDFGKSLRLQVNPARPADGEGRPVYAVFREGTNGITSPVYGKDGRPIAYQPDWKSSPEAKRQGGEAQRRFEHAHEMWQRRAQSAATASHAADDALLAPSS